MARTGLYKSEVKRARDALLAKSKHPSVDAIRVELGNTGSKTTIHKYLKELEEEDGGDTRKISISEALQNMIERLAAQLQDESNATVDQLKQHAVTKERECADALATMRNCMDDQAATLENIETGLRQEENAHGRTREALQKETIARSTNEQQVIDLRERLFENESHRQSLEQKHEHARQALEHYRESVKEQREQDQRRHEQQIQQLQAELRQLQQSLAVKQDEVTRLNQEGVRLVTDLSHVKKTFHDQQSLCRALEQKIETSRTVELQCKILEARNIEKETQVKEFKQQAVDATQLVATSSAHAHALDVELAIARATLIAQQAMVEELRVLMHAKETLLQPQ